MLKQCAILLVGVIIGLSAIYWGQPWLNEVEHVKYTKTVTSVRDASYKTCEMETTNEVGTRVQETLYDCGRGIKFFIRAKETSYWIERKHKS